jgi:hypothetical protein
MCGAPAAIDSNFDGAQFIKIYVTLAVQREQDPRIFTRLDATASRNICVTCPA